MNLHKSLLTEVTLSMIFHGMNIRSIADKIGMDYDAALEDFCGDVAAISTKLLSFPAENGLQALEAAIDTGDMEGARKAARTLRKSAEKISLSKLAEECSKVEKAEEAELNNAYKSLRTLYISIVSILEGEE